MIGKIYMLWNRKMKEKDRNKFEYYCELAKESEYYHKKMNGLIGDIEERLKSCNHVCKNPIIREIGSRKEYNREEKTFDSIIIYGETGFCEKCNDFYRRKYEKIVERVKRS